MLSELNKDYLLIGSGLLFIAALVLFQVGKEKQGIRILVLASLVMAGFMAGLDPFLNLWDEQFHALVAKNLVKHPLKPTLYEQPVMGYDYRIWSGNHVWLHKQPLFLWPMALSIHWFGVNEWSVRLPSVLMHGILTYWIFRIGKIALNSKVGFYGAALFSFAYYPLELVVGKFATDHNDFSFLFYLTACFWAWFEFRNDCHRRWIIAIGVFSGMAILVKWLVGWLIFPIWFMVILWRNREQPFKLGNYPAIFISFLISCLVFLPWQWYIIHEFPREAIFEFQLNTRHFFQAVENHGGDVWFHWKALKILYASGDLLPYLLVVALGYFVWKLRMSYRILVLGSILTVYGFYTLATTKMLSFCFIVSPFVFLALGHLIYGFELRLIKWKLNQIFVQVLSGFILALSCYGIMDLHRIESNHSMVRADENDGRFQKLEQQRFIRKIEQELPNTPHVVFNADVNVYGQIPLMFYTPHIAYDFIPDSMQIVQARLSNFPLAIRDDGRLPEFIRNDAEIRKIEFP